MNFINISKEWKISLQFLSCLDGEISPWKVRLNFLNLLYQPGLFSYERVERRFAHRVIIIFRAMNHRNNFTRNFDY